MKLHLNFDGNQNNGIIFNEQYDGCLFSGIEHKPNIGYEYYSFSMSEVFPTTANNFVQLDDSPATRHPLTDDDIVNIKQIATNWVQPLGQEGNPTEEQLIAKARSYRNQLLGQSDWTQLNDVSVATKNEWASYRQLLRDVPQQNDFPHIINWPGKPNSGL
jgi:hypothetical protein